MPCRRHICRERTNHKILRALTPNRTMSHLLRVLSSASTLRNRPRTARTASRVRFRKPEGSWDSRLVYHSITRGKRGKGMVNAGMSTLNEIVSHSYMPRPVTLSEDRTHQEDLK